MPSTPHTSTSQALESSESLIMLITVHGTTPRFSSSDVQHWTALICTLLAFIQSSTTAPNFAIFTSAACGMSVVVTYFRMELNFCTTESSLSFIRLMRPNTSLRSNVSTEIPLASRSFSLYRTVLNAVGRAPIAPIRKFRSPRTTRHTPANHSKSFANSGESGVSVCRVVSEYGMPYWRKLLHADIFPQKLSRRCVIAILPGVSGVACTSTGTPKRESRSVSAIARSSPKFGKVTTTPSIAAARDLNSSAQRFASSYVSTAPYLL